MRLIQGIRYIFLGSLLLATAIQAADKPKAAGAQATPKANSETAEKVVRNVIDQIYNQGNNSLEALLFDPGFVNHSQDPDEPPVAGGFGQNLSNLRLALPDLKLEIENLFTSEDKVVVQGVFTGIFSGPYNSAPPTNLPVRLPVIEIFKVKHSKITDYWGIRDLSSLNLMGRKSPMNSMSGSAVTPMSPTGSTPAAAGSIGSSAASSGGKASGSTSDSQKSKQSGVVKKAKKGSDEKKKSEGSTGK
jgi:predicted ester cyclase